MKKFYILLICFFYGSTVLFGQTMNKKKIESLKSEAADEIEKMGKQIQVMVDKVFSFAELGFQEYETSKYITGVLRENGFEVEEGISGIPTAWRATWGAGKPVIALGSDVDCIPKASQKPGVAYHDPLVSGAPGHGEGHNSGVPLVVASAIVLKKIMEREKIPGTLMVWPGIAEEQIGAKAYYSRDGLFENVDACIFTHVSNNMSVSWGPATGTGLVSVQFSFEGEAAHGAGAPWRGRSALDAVELMNIGWNFKREHLHPLQRSHYVIVDGGDQPNVVPSKASVWYYFRQITYPEIQQLYDYGVDIANGAALMTGTTMTHRILGSAWPRHFNKPIAEVTYENIKKIGLPTWDEKDNTLAKALQKEVGSEEKGLAVELSEFGNPPASPVSGGSDDIGDVSWTVPTITLRYPANIPGLQGHHWSNAVTMATPIAHKGVTAGSKVVALTVLDLLLKPELLKSAKDYFNIQTKDLKYQPFIGKDDQPSIHLNKEIQETFRPQLQKYYYDETKYDSYLEQLGITYPTIKKN